MESNFKLGCLEHKQDLRDYIAESILPTEIVLPKSVDLKPYLPEVFDQGLQGSCSACASGAQKEIAERLDYGFKGRMSYQYIYNLRSNSTEGMSPRETMKILVDKGCVPEELFPYGTKSKPNESLIEKGLRNKNESYAEVHTVEGAKKAIYQALNKRGSAIYFSVSVYNYGPRMWYAKEGEKLQGGHAMVIVGYDDDKKHFIVRNSWGKNWCNDGYTTMSYEDFEKYPWVRYSVLDEKSGELTFKDKIKLKLYKIGNLFKKNKLTIIITSFVITTPFIFICISKIFS